MKAAIFKGAVILLFFGAVLFWLIPAHIQKPAFIPGFAPPPDFWPRVVSWAGLALGALAMVLALLRPASVAPEAVHGAGAADEPPEWELTAPVPTLLLRFAIAVAAIVLFVLLAPTLGFLLSTILLTGVFIALAGARDPWPWRLVAAVALPVALYLFFATMLNTRFPRGALLPLLGA